MIQAALTAEQFLSIRSELPDAGQWSELIRGVAVSLQPPDLDHGTTILNLSKQLAAYVHAGHDATGYPCFDLGLLVERRPDTVFFPAVSYFSTGPRFAEADKEITESVPDLVVELISTQDRRGNLHDKTSAYLQMGVRCIWHVDPTQRVVLVNGPQQSPCRLTEFETLRGGDILPQFQVTVKQLFAEPEWAA